MLNWHENDTWNTKYCNLTNTFRLTEFGSVMKMLWHFYLKHMFYTSFRTSHKLYFPWCVTPKIQRPTRWNLYQNYLDMFPQWSPNFTVWIILENKLLQKWWDGMSITYLRKHHQKNLSSLEFRPSLLHFPFEIQIRYPLVTSVTYRYSICSSVIKMTESFLVFILSCSFLKGLPFNHLNPLSLF